jgi:hypothetical protein
VPRSGQLPRVRYCFRHHARKQWAPFIHACETFTYPSGRLYLTDTMTLLRCVNRSLRRRAPRDERLILIPTEVMNEGCLRSKRARVFLSNVCETRFVVRAKSNGDDFRSRGHELRATIYEVKRAMGHEPNDPERSRMSVLDALT